MTLTRYVVTALLAALLLAAAPAPKDEDDAKKLQGTWQAVTERPKEFASPAGSNVALYTFKRNKP